MKAILALLAAAGCGAAGRQDGTAGGETARPVAEAAAPAGGYAVFAGGFAGGRIWRIAYTGGR